ncbi:MAG TPA: hypothetical protein DIT67_09430 [Octadecabacter sp.]|nr:hypothetical protein [Octadecabacter sp.]
MGHTATKRLTQHLIAAMRAHRSTGARPVITEAGRVLWRAFIALSRTRSYSSFGPNPISYQEIEAWCRLTRTPLAPHHIEILCALDQEWLRGGADGTPAPRSDLTAAAFDAAIG